MRCKNTSETTGDDLATRGPGAPAQNSNAIKHGHYRVKTQDPSKSQRIRRRVNRRLEGVPAELRPVMRPVTYAMVEVEDRLQAMREYLDDVGIVNDQGEPRKLVTEYRHYWSLWLQLANSNGSTLQSFMATRKDALVGDATALARWADGASQ